jgi:type II secretory pathway predicted ATPase ExeA
LSADKAVSMPFITDSHSNALDQLNRAFSESRALAVMIGEGKAGASLLLNRFLTGVQDDVAVARISEPSSDALGGMQQIIKSVGFDFKDMGLTDLEKVFKMFLASQRINRRRTIICVEEAQDNGEWMLDQLRRLIELAEAEKYGLMVILSGRPSLHEMLNVSPLDALAARAEGRISLAPFTLAETREFVRWMIEAAGVEDVGQLFDFDAVTLIHELCSGIPDSISTICIKSRELARKQKKAKVTTEQVRKAADMLHLTPNVRLSDVDTVMMKAIKVEPEEDQQVKGRLIVRTGGVVVQDQPLNRDRILVGRDEVCDIRIPSHLVSRHHALIVNSPEGAKLVDLGSTNGTYVDGREVKQCDLEDRQVIGIGDSQIEYIAAVASKDGIRDFDTGFGMVETGEDAPVAADFSGELEIVDWETEAEKTAVDPERKWRHVRKR